MIISKENKKNSMLQLEAMIRLTALSNRDLLEVCHRCVQHYTNAEPDNYNMEVDITEVSFETLSTKVCGIISIDYTWWLDEEEHLLKVDIFDPNRVRAYNMDSFEEIFEDMSIINFLKF